MTVIELIKELEKFNPDADILSITVGNGNEWYYTSEPKLSSSKNMFGERVWIK